MSGCLALPPPLGSTAELLKLAYAGHDLLPRHVALLEKLQAAPDDPAVLMDLSVIEQLLGDQSSGLRRQERALAQQRVYQSSWPASDCALRVLVFAAPGDIGTNTPVDFLLQGSDTVLYVLYVSVGQPLPAALPPHDVAIVTMGESDVTRPLLEKLTGEIAGWPCRVLNEPARVLDLSREKLAPALAGVPGVVMPGTVRVDRAQFGALAAGRVSVREILADAEFPIIARPVGSHAGRGLEKLSDAAAMSAYLGGHDDAEFYISGYVDYRSADGLFRKYRIVWVDSVPYPCHMAICNDWKVWYLNADMAENAANRAEEALFMTDFPASFTQRHEVALAAIPQRLGLEYFGVDCAETRDGRLLVFEGDISLIVHDMDPVEVFPYKQPAIRALFAAYQMMLKRYSRAVSIEKRII